LFVNNSSELIGSIQPNKNGQFVAINPGQESNSSLEGIGSLSKHTYLGASESNVNTYGFANNLDLGNSYNLFQYLSPTSYVTAAQNSQNTYVTTPSNSLKIGTKILSTNYSKLLALPPLADNQAIEYDNQIIPASDISSNISTQIQNLSGSDVKVLNTGNNILNDNNDFDKGLWSPIKDCLKNGVGSVSLINFGDSHGNAGEVSSNPYVRSCLGKSDVVNIQSSKTYQLSFDYKALKGSQLTFFYNVGNNANGKYTGNQYYVTDSVKSSGWNTLKLTIPPQAKDANDFDIFFYAPESKYITSDVAYDNIAVKPYTTSSTFNIALTYPSNVLLAKNVTVTKGSNAILINGANLLNGNVNFNNAPWIPVEDCIGHDSNVSWLYSNQTSIDHYIEVKPDNTSKSCTSQSYGVNLKSYDTYAIGFDYKNIQNNKLQFYYNLHTRYDTQSNYQYFVRSNTTSKQWTTYSSYFAPPAITKTFDLFFYTSPDSNDNGIDAYDNVTLKAYAPVDADNYYLERDNSVITDPQTIGISRHWSLFGSRLEITDPPKNFILSNHLQAEPTYLLNKLTNVLSVFTSKFSNSNKVVINGTASGWYIQRADYCNNKSACVVNLNIIDLHFFVFLVLIALISIMLVLIAKPSMHKRKRRLK
jgi:hypothetical protein